MSLNFKKNSKKKKLNVLIPTTLKFLNKMRMRITLSKWDVVGMGATCP